MNIIQAHIYVGDRIRVADTDNEQLHIFSCGHFYDIDRDTCISRPEGRSDYQLIFVTRGVVYFDGTDGREVSAPAGSIIVYKPYQPQTYRCKAEEDSAYYWIHFDGSCAEDLLRKTGLYEKNCYFDMRFEEYMPLVYKLISEIRLRRLNYQIQCCCIFCEILTGICRANSSDDTVNSEYNRLMPALNAMEHQMQVSYSIEEYAHMCNISSYHFMHLFKKYMKHSPMQYKSRLSMERAKYLLAHSDMTISEIAVAVGVGDSMYFSKKFRSFAGVSPSEYRARKNSE